jgi:hypothetical protein
MSHLATATDASINPLDAIPNWHPSDNKFTGDEMIDAYFLGRQAGIQAGWDEKFQILANQFRKNIESAVKISEEFYKEVLENNVSLKTIHLKSEGLSKFTSLFIADLNDFVSEDFLKVHNIARKYRGSNRDKEIYISFLFMPYSEKINQDCLDSDGYFLRYDKNK